ncbi:MAG TPA: T9SS type A sorting domain-containing protein [Phnomibacter sp.]|nr:T9SS type A sorting domain-containing protein [Phnomibacter sp.]
MRKTLLLGILVYVTTSLNAQWLPDATTNNAVVTVAQRGNTGTVNGLVSATDGDGGMFIAWLDPRNAATGADIYITRLKADGTVAEGFTPGGTLVCNAAGAQSNLAMVDDGAGGVVLAWQDPRDNATTSNDIYAERITGTGIRLWSSPEEPNGKIITNQSFNETQPSIARINGVEVAIVWRTTVGANNPGPGIDLFGNYFTLADCSRALASDFTIDGNNGQTIQSITADGSGGLLLAWADNRVTNNQPSIRVQKLNAGGVKQWATDGVIVRADALNASNALNPAIVPDGSGGCVVAWGDTRNGATNQDIYIQRVDNTGAPLWGTNGIQVDNNTANQTNPVLVKVGANFCIAFNDQRNGTANVDLYAQLYNPAGVALWNGGSPLIVCNAAGNQPALSSRNAVLVPDDSGNITFIWDDRRNGNTDENIYAKRVFADGTSTGLWDGNGVAIATRAASNQNNPVAVAGTSNSVIIAWPDNRTENVVAEIYASRVERGGVLPLSLMEFDARPSQNTVQIHWEATNEVNLAYYVVEKSTDGQRFNLLGTLVAKNAAQAQYNITDAYPAAGNNFYRLRSVDKDGSFSLSGIVRIAFTGKTTTIVRSYPNPVQHTLLIEMANMPTGNYTLRIADTKGRITTTRQLYMQSSFAQWTVPVQNMKPGLYLVQIVNAKAEVVSTQKLLKE